MATFYRSDGTGVETDWKGHGGTHSHDVDDSYDPKRRGPARDSTEEEREIHDEISADTGSWWNP